MRGSSSRLPSSPHPIRDRHNGLPLLHGFGPFPPAAALHRTPSEECQCPRHTPRSPKRRDEIVLIHLAAFRLYLKSQRYCAEKKQCGSGLTLRCRSLPNRSGVGLGLPHATANRRSMGTRSWHRCSDSSQLRGDCWPFSACNRPCQCGTQLLHIAAAFVLESMSEQSSIVGRVMRLAGIQLRLTAWR